MLTQTSKSKIIEYMDKCLNESIDNMISKPIGDNLDDYGIKQRIWIDEKAK